MRGTRTLGVCALIVGVILNNLAYVIDLVKDGTGVIILGTQSLLGIAAGIVLVLYGMFVLVRAGTSPS